MAIRIDNMRIERATVINKQDIIEFQISIIAATGQFLINHGNSEIASGIITEIENQKNSELDKKFVEHHKTSLHLQTEDIYKDFRLHGFEYHGLFKCIVSADLTGNTGQLRWNCN